VAGVEGEPSLFAQAVLVDNGSIRRRAPIHPDETRTERLPGGVHGDAAVELAGNAESGDLILGDTGLGERFGDGRTDRGTPQRRILFGPAGTGIVRFIRSRRFAQQTKLIIEDDGLETLSAYIDADDGYDCLSRGLRAGGQNIV
jgi:hypothetical protein